MQNPWFNALQGVVEIIREVVNRELWSATNTLAPNLSRKLGVSPM